MFNARKHGFLLCEAAGAALWLVLALCVCPGAGLAMPALLVGIWILVRLAARGLDLNSKAELRSLFGAMMLLGILLIINTDFFLSHPGATEGHPYLANYDSARYWAMINAIMDGHTVPPDTFVNYAYAMTVPVKLMGLRGVLGFNALCIMLTICFSGRIARECCPTKEAEVSAATMIMLTLAFNFLAHGTVLLKDALVAAGFSGFAACLLILRNHPVRPWAVAGAVLACLTAITVRGLCIPLILGLTLLLLPWKQVLNGKQKRTAIVFGVLVIVVLSYSFFLNALMNNSMVVLSKDTARGVNEMVFSNSQRGSMLTSFISEYPLMPVWERVALLPLTMALQLLLPLPWTYLRHFDYGPSMMLAHMGYPLYLAAGFVIYFFIFAIRKAPHRLVLTSLGGLMFYAMVAYAYGGTVSRYALMLLPLLLPAGAWALINCRTRRSLKLWMSAYVLLLTIALGTGIRMYNMMPSGNDLLC